MSPAPSPTGSSSTPAGGAKRLDVLFVLWSLDYLRFFQSVLELLVERGHRVRLLLGRAEHGQREEDWLARMDAHEGFTWELADHFADRRSLQRQALRRGLEYLRSLRASYTWAPGIGKRLRRSPRLLRLAMRLPGARSEAWLRALSRLLSAVERSLPGSGRARRYLAGLRPEVVALCDHGQPGSTQSRYLAEARRLGIPTALCVASWDNLTTRQRTLDLPQAMLVWNATQVREAVELHGVPADRLVVTGAPCFDDWFSRRPRPRAEFLGRVGLDPDRPVLLWVGGALIPSARTEADFAAAWVAALRSSGDPILERAGVLMRPHPYRVEEWAAVDVSGLGNTAIWPRNDLTMPVDDDQRADYYDSIFHSIAVVGINTSAMIEASIVGRPVLAVLDPDFHDSQLGSFHFSYLLESSGGAVQVAASVEDSLARVREILAGRDPEATARAQRFVGSFVRPQGIERPSTPTFVDALEGLALAGAAAEPDPGRVVVLRGVLLPFLWSSDLVWLAGRVLFPPRLRRAVPRAARRARKLARAGRGGARRRVLKPARRLVLVRAPAAFRAHAGPLRRVRGPASSAARASRRSE